MISYSEWLQLRHIAHRLCGAAVLKGELPKAAKFDCVDCGEPATGYDHRDYRKPLDVVPVCRKCNSRRGNALPECDMATRRKVGRPATGLKFNHPVTFRWSKKGARKIAKRAKQLNMSQAEYLRQLVEADCA